MRSRLSFPYPSPVLSVKPLALAAPGRGQDLLVRITAPLSGGPLPVIVFAHGFQSSLEGYAPLVDYWAGHGFAVVQPTFLDSATIGLHSDDPRTPTIWRRRIEDVRLVLDRLEQLASEVPGLAGRLDPGRVAVAGHSFGASTAADLLGQRVRDPSTSILEDFTDERVISGVLLAPAGLGGDALTPDAAARYPFFDVDFEEMWAPALIVAGDRDDLPFTTLGPAWTTQAYRLSPGEKHLLTLFDGEHTLGGVTGYDDHETSDEQPERVRLVQRVTTAFLAAELGIDSAVWSDVREDLRQGDPVGRLESRS